MTSTQRSRVAAGAVFFLIAGVTLGGMTWATVSSFELARKNVLEERERLVSRALGLLDSHMGGILNAEAARDPSDYWRVHEAREGDVVAVYAPGGIELNVARVVLHSPLAVSDPPLDWIDVYFQWAPQSTNDVLTSPQIAEAEALWTLEHLRADHPVDRERRRVWDWLEEALPSVDLHERLAKVCTSNPLGHTTQGSSARDRAVRVASEANLPLSREYQQRRDRFRDSQFRYLPPDACVDARHLRATPSRQHAAADEAVPRPDGYVPLTVDPITAFWLGVGPGNAHKLAFVRECHLGGELFYQGFVGDWSRLEPTLLAIVDDLLDDADLVAVPDSNEPDPDERGMLMSTLPVRLSLPEMPGGAAAAAWQRVRGTLITGWGAAAVVLVVAGMGLRNLVALTERRSQFAYAVTHELRTPLTTFRLYSDMLAAGLVPDNAKPEYMTTLDRESQRLSNLVEEVLEYARLEHHKVKLNPTATDGASLLAVVADTLEKRCSDNGIQARTENALANGRTVRTDVDLLQRIAGVLVNNACRYARGSQNATVLLRLEADGDRLHVDVIDTGPGIERGDGREIFKPFRRGRGTGAAAHGGIGLGLALARSWARLLGGRLELAAHHHAVYGGAHFRLSIPVRIDS